MRKYVGFGLLLICASALADGTYTNHYVWTNSPFAGTPYNDWTNAAHDIQTAISYASAGDTVWVTNGVYTNSLNGSDNNYQVNITKQITLKSVNGADVTIINGNYPLVTNMCINASSVAGIIVDGFTITNGYRTSQYACAGITIGVVDGAGGIIKNCVVSGNRSTNAGNNGEGAGICVYGTNGLIDNCVISGNSNSFQGGGVYFYNENSTMQFCRVVGNISATGGGVYARKIAVIKNCVISNNVVYGASYHDGGGIALTGGGIIQDCLICSNIAFSGGTPRGGGVYAGGTFEVRNCTIVKNVADQGGGLFYYDAPGPIGSVVNTIIGLNTLCSGSAGAGSGVAIAWGLNNLDVSFTNCSLQRRADVAGKSTTNDQCLFEINNGFVDTAADNFRLLPTSPCVNTGTNQDWMTNAVDLAGNSRIYNVIVDMGAYEYGSYVHYVSTNGTNDSASGYNTWAGAATQIQWAADAAVAGDTVLVSNGVYSTDSPRVCVGNPAYGMGDIYSTVLVSNSIILKSVNGPLVTVIDAINLNRVITIWSTTIILPLDDN